MSSRLLTLMRKRGGFSPLSLNPTLLALPENSFSRTGGQFTAASSQYLSVASNAELQTGDVDFWVAGWVNPNSAANGAVIAKNSTTSNEYELDYITGIGSNVRFRFYINAGVGLIAPEVDFPINNWYFLFGWHDPVENKCFLFINSTLYSASTSGTAPNTGSAQVQIGARELAADRLFHNGQIDNVLFGKPPASLGDGTEGSLAHTIATALYNSGNGLAFQDITSQQESDWGIVSGWLDNSLTADAFGSNTLTNNNGVTQAAGKVNAVAVDNDPTYFVNDATPNDNDLTQVAVANRPRYDVDAFGSGKHGWYFDGNNDYFSIASFTHPSVFSYSFWLKPAFNHDSVATTYNIIDYGFLFRYEGRNISGVDDQFVLSLDNGGSTYHLAIPFFTFSSGDIIHIAFTLDYDTKSFKVYLNGLEADTDTTSVSMAAHTTVKYGVFSSDIAGWLGHLGPILMTPDILTASEILSLYNHGPQ